MDIGAKWTWEQWEGSTGKEAGDRQRDRCAGGPSGEAWLMRLGRSERAQSAAGVAGTPAGTGGGGG